MEEHQIVLMDENKVHAINVWFLGFTLEQVQEFVKEHYADNPKNWRWTQFKIAG